MTEELNTEPDIFEAARVAVGAENIALVETDKLIQDARTQMQALEIMFEDVRGPQEPFLQMANQIKSVLPGITKWVGGPVGGAIIASLAANDEAFGTVGNMVKNILASFGVSL